MGLVSSGFLLFTLLNPNRSKRLISGGAGRRGSDPVLSGLPLAILHPSVQNGYVGFSRAFLLFCHRRHLDVRLDQTWAK